MSFIILGYYADWNVALSPEQIDGRAFTHLCHAFATVAPDGSLRLPDKAKSQALVKQSNAHGVSLLLSVGGASSNAAFNRACETPAKTQAFAQNIVQAAQSAGYDGVDIDWEVPENAGEQARMNALVQALRRLMPRALLTMATPATDWSGKWFEAATLTPLLDWANVMAYDLYGPWSSVAGLHAPLSPFPANADSNLTIPAALRYYQDKKWPANKIALGIPLYGRGFRAPEWGSKATGTFERSALPYHKAIQLTTPEWRKTRQGGMVCLHKSDQTEVFAYDDAQTVKEKAQLARKAGLRGVFFWEISQDFNGKTNPLVRAAG